MNRELDFKYFIDNQTTFLGCMKLVSKNKGPHLLIIGGTHGNEPSGVQAIIKIHKQIKKDPQLLQAGSITFLLANPKAYEQNSRYVDYDLNRSFIKNKNSNYEGERAKSISSFIYNDPSIDAILDIHSVSKGDSQIMVYNANNKDAQKLALEISPIRIHLGYHPSNINGLLIEEAASITGAQALAIECGNHDDPNSSKVAFFHIYKFLLHFGLIDNNKDWIKENAPLDKEQNDIVYYEVLKSIKPTPGLSFSSSTFTTGSFLKSGELYAQDNQGDLKTTEDCYLVMPALEIKKSDHDAGFLCSKKILKK